MPLVPGVILALQDLAQLVSGLHIGLDCLAALLPPAVAGVGGQTVPLPLQLRWLGDTYDEARQLRTLRLAIPLAGFEVTRTSRGLASASLANPTRLQAAVGALFLGQLLG